MAEAVAKRLTIVLKYPLFEADAIDTCLTADSFLWLERKDKMTNWG